MCFASPASITHHSGDSGSRASSERARTRYRHSRCRPCPPATHTPHCAAPEDRLDKASPYFGLPSAPRPHCMLAAVGSVHSFQPATLRRGRDCWHPAAFMWAPDEMSASCCGRLPLCPGCSLHPAASKRELTAPESYPCRPYVSWRRYLACQPYPSLLAAEDWREDETGSIFVGK